MKTQMNSSGKVLVIFLVIFVILSLSLAGLSMFFLSKEIEKRKATESALQETKTVGIKLEAQLQDAIKQGFVLQEKNKEADEKINGLLDELELQEGLRDKLKEENLSLKTQLEEQTKAKDEIQKKIAASEDAEKKVAELEGKLQVEINAKQELEQKIKTFEQRTKDLEEDLSRLKPEDTKPAPSDVKPAAVSSEQVELEKIVIAPPAGPEGRILTVDTETEFVIVSLGANQGAASGDTLSVYRGENYLGDIKITRLQPEMSAADFIPPLSSKDVRKDDRVVVKK